MFEILALLLLVAWVIFSVAIALRTARVAHSLPLRLLVIALLAPSIAVLPIVDEIVGKFQFDRLCSRAMGVTIYGTIPVGEELYGAGGKWRLSPSNSLSEEYKKAKNEYDSLIRWNVVQTARTTEFIPISQTETKIYARKTGVLLAEVHSFGTSGGWISRKLEKPLLVRDHCVPESLHSLQPDQRILPYRGM